MRWLAFGTYDAGRHPRVGVLIEGLRARGHELIEINAPLPLSTADRVAMLRQPWRLPIAAGRLLGCWGRLVRQARRARRSGPIDAVLVGYLGHFDVRLAKRLFRGVPIALDHLVSAAGTADDRGLARSGGLKHRLLRRIDRAALAAATVVMVDTEEHLHRLPPEARDRGVVVPVGAGQAWFDAGQAWFDAGSAPPPGPRGRVSVVFVGLFTPLHGATTIGAALGALAGDDRFRFTMIGTGQEYDACRGAAASNANVTWIDWVNSAELPAIVSGHDVSLGIFGGTAKAQLVVPTKVFQGLAARCAVVTSDTAPQRAALGDAAVLVPPADAEALVKALQRLADYPDELAAIRDRGYALAVRRYAPASVVAPLLEMIRPTTLEEPAR